MVNADTELTEAPTEEDANGEMCSVGVQFCLHSPKPLFNDEEHHWYSDDLQSAYETSHQQTVNRKVKCRNYHRPSIYHVEHA